MVLTEGLPIFDPRSDQTEEKEINMLKYFSGRGIAGVLMRMKQKK